MASCTNEYEERDFEIEYPAKKETNLSTEEKVEALQQNAAEETKTGTGKPSHRPSPYVSDYDDEAEEEEQERSYADEYCAAVEVGRRERRAYEGLGTGRKEASGR